VAKGNPVVFFVRIPAKTSRFVATREGDFLAMQLKNESYFFPESTKWGEEKLHEA